MHRYETCPGVSNVWEKLFPMPRMLESKPPPVGGQEEKESSHWVTVWTPLATFQTTVSPTLTGVSQTLLAKEALQK